MSGARIGRRALLIGSAAAAGGVAFGLWRLASPGNPLAEGLAEGEAALTPYVLVAPGGITLIVPRADVGQGIAALQADLIAEELDIDPATATLSPGQPHPVYANGTVAADGLPIPRWRDGMIAAAMRAGTAGMARAMGLQITGGSTSTADMHETLRRAGAVARETLKQAAAERTGLRRADLSTEDGAVLLPDGRRIPYAALAAEAAAIAPVTDVALRPPNLWRRLGQPRPRRDVPAKSTGRQVYGIDVRLPGMLFATVRRNPAVGAGVRRLDAAAARAMPGVRSVVPVAGGVGVIAETTWHAFRAAEAVEIDWEVPERPGDDAAIRAHLEAAHAPEHRDSRLCDEGDVEGALTGAEALTGEYVAPFLAHAALEPLSATVRRTPEGLEIWTATQVPDALRDAAAALAGLAPEAVTLHLLPAGGSFGRRLDFDYVLPAIELALSAPGFPVQTTLSREEDMRRDFPRPMHLARARGAVREGRVEALDLDIVGQSVTESWFDRILFAPPLPDTLLVAGAFDAPYAIPHRRVTGYRAPAVMPVGSWRSPGACANSFFLEGFLDELIHAAGADPLEERLRLIDHADSRRVLEAAGEMCGWAGPDLGPGRGRGLAFAYAHGVPVAAVLDVSETEWGLRLDAAWIAADCGTVYDPINAEAQATGGLIFGLGHAMTCALTYENHRPRETNFHEYPAMGFAQAPRVSVRLLGRAAEVRGLGEPTTAAAAPALAAAIFAATGRRLREMPFDRAVDFA